jgi:RND family efflux transporter MFP subunit
MAGIDLTSDVSSRCECKDGLFRRAIMHHYRLSASWTSRPSKRQRVAAATLLLASALATACAEAPEVEEVIRPVRYEAVLATGGSRVREFSGIAQAGLRSRLSFKVTGTVSRLPAQVGDSVSGGQLLAQLDPADYDLAVQEAVAGLSQATAQERRAGADYQRAQELWENNNLSRAELDAAQAADQSARAAVRAAQQRLEMAQRQLAYTRLTAPVAGAISSVDVDVGENVSRGQTVVELTSGSRPEVQIGIPELLIAQVRQRDLVDVRFDAIPDNTYRAVITEVGVAPTGAGGTFPVIVQLTRNDAAIRVGMAASVEFRFEAEEDGETIYVPPVAVGEDRDGRFVFVVEPEEAGFGIAHRRAVVMGDPTLGGIEIVEGLSDGELVVTAGVRRIQDGQRVRLLDEGDQ